MIHLDPTQSALLPMTTVTEAAVLSATASTTLLKILIKKHDRSLSGLLKAPDSYEETFPRRAVLASDQESSTLHRSFVVRPDVASKIRPCTARR